MSGKVIQTIKQNCRRCYTCVRDCPAKAIRIEDGQAFVVEERCLGCGNCTMVCSQNAKAYLSGIEGTVALLERSGPVAALLAPSFPADFPAAPGRLVGALREAGFSHVVEVAYGADIVSTEYREYLREHPEGLHIATACPAVVEYVRKYNPDLTDCLVPIVSPMVATARAVRVLYGADVRTVFIGPCVAKKLEALDPQLDGEIDEVLTFQELHRLFDQRRIAIEGAAATEFDPPRAGHARVFPLVGGLLDSAGLEHGLLDPEVLVVSGHDETVEVLSGLRREDVDSTLLVEALMCHGCYAGPGMQTGDPGLVRKQRIGEYVWACENGGAAARQTGDVAGDGAGTGGAAAAQPSLPAAAEPAVVDLTRAFVADDQRLKQPTEAQIREILAHTNKFFPEDELNCGACGYGTCREKAIAVYRGMAEEAMCLPFMIEQAERVCHELKLPWQELRDVHRHLINTEKLASMGQMAAGVAHELNNPLSTILLYTHILGRKLKDRDDLTHDLALMADESQRCKRIIGNLLDFARQSRVQMEPVEVEGLLRQAADAAAAGLSGDGRVKIEVAVEAGLQAEIDRDQMSQVMANLVKNAVEAMDGRSGTVRLEAAELPDDGRLRISISDQGCGIPAEARDKVFQPFFTTKSIGQGTGLGLPISYGIVKMHRGQIWFDSEPGRGTTFHVELPTSHAQGGRSIIDEHASVVS
jgi:two-component system NtrC family sensor kinase